jgi:hypothetical protein
MCEAKFRSLKSKIHGTSKRESGEIVFTEDGWNKGLEEYVWIEMKNDQILSQSLYHGFS